MEGRIITENWWNFRTRELDYLLTERPASAGANFVIKFRPPDGFYLSDLPRPDLR